MLARILNTFLLLTGFILLPNLTFAQDTSEEIIVARSYREFQIPVSELCAENRIGFLASSESSFSFWSVQISGENGVVSNTRTTEIGSIYACFGPTDTATVLNFYGEGSLNGVSYTGLGFCFQSTGEPEPGILLHTCSLELQNLPDGYIGGRLTTNSINSRISVGDVTDPPGYTQQSIATVRLWKRGG